jgi:hypothetical protein
MSLRRTVLVAALAALLGPPASAQTFDAWSRGWYHDTGRHTASNFNTFVGQSGTGINLYRSFFVFDLRQLAHPVESGVLRLELEAFFGPNTGERFTLSDVTTDVATLRADQTTRTDIYEDLGSGVVYGAGRLRKLDVGLVVDVPLTPEAIADINRVAGGHFAIGVRPDTIELSSGSEGLRFSLAGERRVHQLVLVEAASTLAIEPGTAFLSPPAEHALTARILDGAGAPVAGAAVSFAVVEGPHAGLAGSADTDASGAAPFSYAGEGVGVDRIAASFADPRGFALEAESLAFWDQDCNQNQVPDTCDLACDGFDGACSAFADCGGSLDADASGSPDECNQPPDCASAFASPSLLRPSGQRWREVALGGVADPDGDEVQITVESVFQDEPVEARGSGRSCPDAALLPDGGVALRPERARGDGRVYHLEFRADDGRGGTCTGTALVCVSHGWRRRASCVDGGALYDSTQCAEPSRGGHGHGGHLHRGGWCSGKGDRH